MTAPSNPSRSGAPGLDLREWAGRLRPHAGRILLATVLAGVLTFLVALLLPRWYRATAVILPPDETDLLSNISFAGRALSKFPAFGELGEYFTPADIYKAILKSRTVQDELIDRFGLTKVYRLKSLEKTRKALEQHSSVKLAPDGTITVSVDDRDPRRAAAMANEMLVGLDRYNIEKRNTQAHRTRVFLERRVAETDSALRRSEVVLRAYQEKHHTVAPTNLVNAPDVSAAADLMARRVALEVRLGVLRGYLREDNEQILQTKSELDQLTHQVSVLPALQTDLARLIRDNKIQEQIFLLLTAELEQTRIMELKNTPTVQVLDSAVAPERPIRPRKLTLSAGAALLAFLVSVGWALRREPGAVTTRA